MFAHGAVKGAQIHSKEVPVDRKGHKRINSTRVAVEMRKKQVKASPERLENYDALRCL